LKIQDFRHAVALYAQATLRDVIGGVELDFLLSERDKIAEEIKKIVDVATDPWGIDVSTIKIQDIELPADMKRVMAKQAEAEKEEQLSFRQKVSIQLQKNCPKRHKCLVRFPAVFHCVLFKRLKKLTPILQRPYSLLCQLSLWKELNLYPAF